MKWQVMEERGAVFLPLAGVRIGSNNSTGNGYVSSVGCYWSSSTRSDLIGHYTYEQTACYLVFGNTNPYPNGIYAEENRSTKRYYGFSVRLSRDRN